MKLMKRLVLDKCSGRIAIEFQFVLLQHFCGSEKAGFFGIVAVDMANRKLLSKVLLTVAPVLMLRQSSDAFVSPGALLAAAVVSTAQQWQKCLRRLRLWLWQWSIRCILAERQSNQPPLAIQ